MAFPDTSAIPSFLPLLGLRVNIQKCVGLPLAIRGPHAPIPKCHQPAAFPSNEGVGASARQTWGQTQPNLTAPAKSQARKPRGQPLPLTAQITARGANWRLSRHRRSRQTKPPALLRGTRCQRALSLRRTANKPPHNRTRRRQITERTQLPHSQGNQMPAQPPALSWVEGLR